MAKPETADIVSGFISFFIPGLGQFLQGRVLPGLLFFLAALFFWAISLGWIFHLWAAWDASQYFQPPKPGHF